MGLIVEPVQLSLTANGQNAPIVCHALGEQTFNCTPLDNLPQGDNVITGAVTNDAGTRFESQSVSFVIDSVPPTITLDHPPEHLVTNTAQTELRGALSEPATLTLNGALVAVGTGLTFQQLLTLIEGENLFTLQARDLAGNLGEFRLTVVRDTVPPAIPVSALIAVAASSDGRVQIAGAAGSVEADSQVAVTNQTTGETVIVVANSDGSFNAVLAGNSSDRFVIVARDRAGNGSAPVEVTGAATPPTEDIPPDPASVAPPLPAVGSPPLAERIAFLYTGADPIQRDVAPGTIEAQRVAVLRGAVHDRSGAPISGVKISVLHHPEFGHTLSRLDGVFDLAVNGGGLLTVVYQKNALLPVQRTLQTQWNDWFVADDVVMIPLDPKVTRIDLTDTSRPFQVAQGSVVEDSDGRRQVTVLFPAGTTAEVTRPDGSKAQLSQLDFRATEYTVGASGPAAMPGALPPASAYTYAVELSVDQAREQGVKIGGKDIEFNQPVSFYLDNFLDFPTGIAVPVGYYDADIAAWVPYPNGRIIGILREEGGQAVLDVSGNGQPATAQDLTTLGITGAELTQLADVYKPGISLWRVPVRHFSTWDHNWPSGPPPDAERPDPDLPEQDELPDSDEENKCQGCIISPQAQTLGETIPVAGTPYALHYQSERAQGFDRNRVTIPLTGDSIPLSLQTVNLAITIAGQREVHSFAAVPNLTHTFEWDGRDAMGREVVGVALPEIELSYVYPCRYLFGTNGFARFGDVATPIGSRDRCQGFVFSRKLKVALRSPVQRSEVVANWSLSVEHSFEANNGLVLEGDGSRRLLSTRSIETIAGTGASGFSGDGSVAAQARLRSPQGMAIDADGSIYFADTANFRIRRVTADGVIDTVAGAGQASFSGDGGLALLANLSSPVDVAIGADGSVYIADSLDHRIRRISPTGIIDTVAGTGVRGFSGDGGLAIEASFDGPSGVAVAADGSIYVSDSGNQRIRRIAPGGIVDTVAGRGMFGFAGDGGQAAEAAFRNPRDIAVGGDGSLYIADSSNHRIRRITPFGVIDTIAGSGLEGFFGDGESATQATLTRPDGVAVDADGVIYIADTGNHRVRRVTVDGIISTIAGTGLAQFFGDNGPAEQAQLSGPVGVAIDASGNLFVSDTGNQRVRRIAPNGRVASDGIFAIPSRDGAQRLVFGSAGRHLYTQDALTGATVLSFARDTEGRVLLITDADGNITLIERDAGGKPVAIVAPHGQRTRLDVNSVGHLAHVTDPADATWGMQYTDEGLLASVTHPNGHANTFTYDADGRLSRDLDPEGGGWQISRTDLGNGSRIAMTSGEGRVRTFMTERQSGGTRLYTDQAPDGTQTRRIYTEAGATIIVQPDGTELVTREGPDPRFNMNAPVVADRQIALPAGQYFQQTTTRTASLANPDDALSLQTLTETVTTNGRVDQAIYDATARRWTFTSPENRVSTITVDSQSRPLAQAISGLEAVTTSYDSDGRPSSLQVGIGSNARQTTFIYYDAAAGTQAGYLRSVTDAIGRQTQFSYDATGRPIQQTLPDGRSIGFQYDAQGNLIALSPPGRSAHVFEYDGRDQPSTYTPPNLSGVDTVTRYHYNRDRQVTRIERPAGEVIAFDYDVGGRLASRTLPTGSTSYRYQEATEYREATGKLAAVDTSDGIGLALAWNGPLPQSTTWSGPVNGSVGARFDDNLWLDEESITVGSGPAPV